MIKKNIFILCCIIPTFSNPFTLMIDPAGDAKHTGRTIVDTFERGITLQCAELLKKELNKQLPSVRVILTRIPGETIQPLQNASFANKLQVDLYISISFYYEPDIPSHIALFYYATSKTDYWHTFNPLSFYHINQAYLINLKVTQALGKNFLELLKNKKLNPFFKPIGLFAIPCKPLLGIKAPALCIEAGLCQKDDWKNIIPAVIEMIKEVSS